MRRSGVNRKFFWAMLCVMAMLLSLSAGSALASSEAAGIVGQVRQRVLSAKRKAMNRALMIPPKAAVSAESKHWEITDTYKTMNFVVLVAGLFSS